MTDILLATKRAIPSLHTNLVGRPRLIERLEAAQRYQLTLVSAPAGFGKTTLLSHWAEHSRLPAAWIALDEGDNDPARFMAYLASALHELVENAGKDFTPSFHELAPATSESFLAALVNEAAGAFDPRGHVCIILDDYHLIDNPGIHQAITYLIERLPPPTHLVIATRSDPPLPLARLRARGRLNELRQDDLRFTLEESSSFLEATMGLSLAPEEIAALEARTEGWVAGLQLAAVSMQNRQDRAGFITAFTGSNRFVLDYLLEEVFARQPVDIQAFLLDTSILNQLCGPLCEALAAGAAASPPAQPTPAAGQRMLEQIERANLFLTPLDDQRRWYRYHHLFASFLRSRLEQEQPARLPELHRRAASWYQHNGMLEEAVEHALLSQDFELAAGLLETAAEEAIKSSQTITLAGWLEALPRAVLEAHPTLLLFRAWTLLLSGSSLEGILKRLQQVVNQATAPITGKEAVLNAFLAFMRGNDSYALELMQFSQQTLAEDDGFYRSILAWLNGTIEAWGGNLEAGVRTLNHAVQMGLHSGNLMIAVMAMSNQGEILVMQGDLRTAYQRYQRALDLAVDSQGRLLPVAGSALIGLGDVWREWNELEQAEKYLREGIELTLRWGRIGALDGYIALARLHQARGDAANALQTIQEALDLAREFDTTLLDDRLVEIHLNRLQLRLGELEKVEAWLDQMQLLPGWLQANKLFPAELGSLLHSYLQTMGLINQAWLWIETGRSQEARDVLDSLSPVMLRVRLNSILIQIHFLQGLACQAQGQPDQALAYLEQALALSEPQGHVRIYLDFGPRATELLHLAVQRGGSTAPAAERLLQANGLMHAAHPETHAPIPASSRPLSAPIEPFSARELQVLRLLAAGLSNQEIADELVVAVSTVKTHTNNLYRKLGTSKRTQAVARAREFGLL